MKGSTRMGQDKTLHTIPLICIGEKKKEKRFSFIIVKLATQQHEKNHMAINVFLQCTE